jgi:hypothetical protein
MRRPRSSRAGGPSRRTTPRPPLAAPASCPSARPGPPAPRRPPSPPGCRTRHGPSASPRPRQASPACSACPRAAIDPQNDAGDDACSCAQSTGAASLIASAPAIRPMGTRASTSAAGPGRQMRPPAVFVPCGPGAMTSTVTPQGASSPAARRPVAQPQSHARAIRSATALAACRAARVSRSTANRACVRNSDHDARASPSRGAT